MLSPNLAGPFCCTPRPVFSCSRFYPPNFRCSEWELLKKFLPVSGAASSAYVYERSREFTLQPACELAAEFFIFLRKVQVHTIPGACRWQGCSMLKRIGAPDCCNRRVGGAAPQGRRRRSCEAASEQRGSHSVAAFDGRSPSRQTEPTANSLRRGDAGRTFL